MMREAITSSAWLLDVMVGAIILACACVRGTKGIYKSLMPLAAIAAAAICATFSSAVLTEPVTEALYPVVEEKLLPALHLDEIPKAALERFSYRVTEPEQLHEMADEIVSEDTQKILVMLNVDLKHFLQDAWEQAEVAEKVQDYLSDDQIEKLENLGIDIKVAANTAIDATKSALNAEAVFFSAIFSLMYRLVSIGIHYFLWCLFCVLFLVVFTIIKDTFGLAFKLPVIGWVDKAGGAILGIVIGCAVLYVIGWILKFVGWTALHDLGEGTKLFSLFFS
jgi:hypothetical protein